MCSYFRGKNLTSTRSTSRATAKLVVLSVEFFPLRLLFPFLIHTTYSYSTSTTTINMTPGEHADDCLSLLFGDDDAKGILEALAAIEDGSHQRACRLALAFDHGDVAPTGPQFGPPPPPVEVEKPQPPAVVEPKEDAKPAAVTEYKKPCHPYFYYRDFSTLTDPDPSCPITSPGRIPNFPAKMYAILSRKDLSDIITWMPHGRSWKVLKPREFEIKVIPTYFEHSKFSSFIRQANGWGFRRIISKGGDRNSYYHELFLRGRPYLIKLMRRPPPSSKPLADSTTEPDFHAISAERPLPEIKDGDSSNDIPQNFPRQATYSFVPPASYQAQSSNQPVENYQPSNHAHQIPTPLMQRPPAAGLSEIPSAPVAYSNNATVEPFNIYSNVPETQSVQAFQHPYQQPHHSNYHQQEHHAQGGHHFEPNHQGQQHDEVLSSMGPAIHPVESTDSLMDLIKLPLPPPERFGPHTFVSLFD